MEKGHLEDREVDGKLILKFIYGDIVRVEFSKNGVQRRAFVLAVLTLGIISLHSYLISYIGK